MFEDFEEKKNKLFKFPDIQKERGEIERVAGIFSPNNQQVFITRFFHKAKGSTIIALNNTMWSVLENTDSYNISANGWDMVRHHAVDEHPDYPRDWEFYRKFMTEGKPVDAPIIVKRGEQFHLVAGNTRLMVARALGITPEILLVDMS